MYQNELTDKIFSISSEEEFCEIALELFRFQYLTNATYREYCDLLKRDMSKVDRLSQIPFLPVSFFKDREIKSGQFKPEKVFKSSGTTGEKRSKHFVKDLSLYERSLYNTFKRFYGHPGNYCFLALLPSYLERDDASLVYMAEKLIERSGHPDSGFYLDDLDELHKRLQSLNQTDVSIFLLGVSFALTDLAEKNPIQLKEGSIVMETGGMKGRKKELIREELHKILQKGFGVPSIHSEYGMTELLSQAYSQGGGRFHAPPWMKILIRETNDPFCLLPPGKTGGVNIIDLANMHSCPFIETMDLGKLHGDGSFEILGRFDQSDIRGCNLMVMD